MEVSRVEGLVPPVEPVAKRLSIHQRELSDSTSARRNDIGMLPSVAAGWWAAVSVTRTSRISQVARSASPPSASSVSHNSMAHGPDYDRLSLGCTLDRVDDPVVSRTNPCSVAASFSVHVRPWALHIASTRDANASGIWMGKPHYLTSAPTHIVPSSWANRSSDQACSSTRRCHSVPSIVAASRSLHSRSLTASWPVVAAARA